MVGRACYQLFLTKDLPDVGVDVKPHTTESDPSITWKIEKFRHVPKKLELQLVR